MMTYVEFGSLLTCDQNLKNVLQAATNVAASKASVLITGESGTGKELLARYIHSKSNRAHKAFVAINCAALPDGLLESELFGYERGAFTGAHTQKLGKFEISSDSTILLDEISEMSLALQAKLLRVLQEEEIDRLGGRSPIKVNLRVIATSNRDLWAMVKSKLFREDLYYRINVIPLHIPPLRERVGDISVLAQHFTKVSCILNSKNSLQLTQEALRKISDWRWPGNVRELENVIERAVLIAGGNEIRGEHIIIDQKNQSFSHSNPNIAAGMTLAAVEKELIYKTLEKTNQNRTQAAKILDISIRTLRNKLNEYKRSGVL